MGGPEMLTHHIAAFLSVALASFTGQAHLYTLLLLSTELTTPFVNGRWFIDQMVGAESKVPSRIWVMQHLLEQRKALMPAPQQSCKPLN